MIYFCCDDVGQKWNGHIDKLEALRERYPGFKANCFVIAKDLDSELKKWIRQDWIYVGLHGWDHDYPPEMERPISERRERLKMAIDVLGQCDVFRFPGWQTTASSIELLQEFGVKAIAHQSRLQLLNERKTIILNMANTHIYDTAFSNFNNAEFGLLSGVL